MKVTSLNLARIVSRQLNDVSSDIINLQSQIGTGKRILKPSDDPIGSAKLVQLSSNMSELEAYKSNMTYGRSIVQTTLTSLDQLLNVLSRLHEIAVQQRGANASSQTRKSAAVEVQNAFEEIIQIANSKLGDKYIYGGHDSLNPPFQTDGSYVGDSGEFRINIGSNADMKINLSGDEVFSVGNGGVDLFGAVQELLTALQTSDALGIGNSIDSISTAFDHINVKISESGAKLNRLENSSISTAKLAADLQLVLSDTLDTDIAKAIIDMSAKQNIMNAALATASKILNLSLINYL